MSRVLFVCVHIAGPARALFDELLPAAPQWGS